MKTQKKVETIYIRLATYEKADHIKYGYEATFSQKHITEQIDMGFLKEAVWNYLTEGYKVQLIK